MLDFAQPDLPPLTDDELTALAMAEPFEPVASADAVNYWDVVAPQDLGLLPSWYMPSPSAGPRRLHGWRANVAYGVAGSIIALNAAGLCITYGHLTLL